MKRVLILNPYYYPGYRSGGPQQTVYNITETFGNECEFYILTQNHDFNSDEIYTGIEEGKWNKVGKAKVKYLSTREFIFRGIKREYQNFDIIYSCGLFEINSIIILAIHRFMKCKGKRVYIAPMGVFSDGAIKRNNLKKTAFLNVCQWSGMFHKIIWSFTSKGEQQEAEKVVGNKSIEKYIIAEDIPKFIPFDKVRNEIQNITKNIGELRIIFLSRICSKKNLIYCAEILNYGFSGRVLFDIYGMIEEKTYWEKCQKKFEELPNNIKLNYCGEAKPEQVVDIFSQYDVFLFPTKGENFGHVIYEALSAGCIPIISDKTPWDEIDYAGCGEVIPIYCVEKFRNKIQIYLDMDEQEMKKRKNSAIDYAERKFRSSVQNSGYRKIFRNVERLEIS